VALDWIRKVIAAFGSSKNLQNRPMRAPAVIPANVNRDRITDECNPFGYKTAWIAVKSDNPILVLNFLKVTDFRSVDWNSGISTSYDQSSRLVAVTPALNGWVIITGSVMLERLPLKRRDSLDGPERILRDLSEHFGEAHFFGTHRVTETHLWTSWHRGELSRYFYCDGSRGEVAEEGVRSQFEEERFEGNDPAWAIDDGIAIGIDEESVMEVAEAWSVNPQQISEILHEHKSVTVTLCRLP